MLAPSVDFTNQTNSTVQEPNIILEISNVANIYGLQNVLEKIYIGAPGLKIDGTWKIGGQQNVSGSLNLIDPQGGNTYSISQQMRQDEASSSSIQSITIELIDLNGRISEILAQQYNFDILGQSARVWFGYKNLNFPDDYSIIFDGELSDYTINPGSVVFSVFNPAAKLTGKIFPDFASETASSIDSSITTIPLTNTDNFIEGQGSLTSYVVIEDEIVQVGAVSGDNLTGCTRGALGTVAASHDTETEVEASYRLQGNSLELALKLMLSDGGSAYADNIPVSKFVNVPGSGSAGQIIYIPGIYMDLMHGVTEGDTVTITGASNATNNVTDVEISGLERYARGTILTLDTTALVAEDESSAIASFTSRYNTLPEDAGLGLLPRNVDINAFTGILDTNFASIFTVDLQINEEAEGKELIEKQLYRPSNCYSLPRNGRTSVGISVPPLSVGAIQTITSADIVDPENMRIRRSKTNQYYNEVVFKYDKDRIEDEYYTITRTVSTDSKELITKTRKPLEILADGVTSSDESIVFSNSSRLLLRYGRGAEAIDCNVKYGTGVKIEVGDKVLFGDENINMTDTKTGSRVFSPRIMEVWDKTINLKTAECKLTLVDTNYATNSRYGTISPACNVEDHGSGYLILSSGFGSSLSPREKWSDLITQGSLVRTKLRIRNLDFSIDLTAELLGFDAANDNKMLITGLSGAITSTDDLLVELGPYENQSSKAKSLHCFLSPSAAITVVNSSTSIEVDNSDADLFYVGCVILVTDSAGETTSEVVVTAINAGVGNTELILSSAITANVGDIIKLIGFSSDEGDPYRFI